MGAARLLPNEISYTTAMNASAKKGDLLSTKKLFDAMVRSSLTPDCVTYTTLVRAHSAVADVSGCLQVLDAMSSHGVSPSIITFNLALASCDRIRPRRCDVAERLFQNMVVA